MNDLEQVLGSRLHDLADEMTGPSPNLPAGEAISRHHRERRARAGMAALAVVVALVAVGVPTGMSLLGAGPSGHGATAGNGTTTPVATTPTTPATDLTDSAAARSAAESATKEAEAQAVLQRLMAQQVTQPLRLTAPARWGACPQTSHLSAVANAPFVYWQGHLPSGPDGCQYVVAPGAAGTSTPATREWVGIGFLTGTTVEQMNAGVAASDSSSGGDCVSSPMSGNAVLQRCLGPDDLHYSLTVPDTGGRGIWVLTVSTGLQYSVDPGMALEAVTFAAERAFPG